MSVKQKGEMAYVKTFWILLVFVECVETSFVSNVTCLANGDVFIRNRGQRSSLILKGFECLLATSGNKECAYEQSDETLRIFECLEPNDISGVEIVLRTGAESLWIVKIECYFDDLSRQRHQTQNIPSFPKDQRPLLPGTLFTPHDVARRRRSEGETPDNVRTGSDEGIRELDTSVSFRVKLNFSNNDEIMIKCIQKDGILYLSNPDPKLFRSLLAFSDFTKRKCKAEFLDSGNFVAVGDCSLDYPIVVAFSVRKTHASVIGGTSSNFKVYNINCSETKFSRANVFPDYYDPNGAENHLRRVYVTIVTALLLVMLVCGPFLVD